MTKVLERHETPPEAVPVVGERTLWVLNVHGEEVRVTVTNLPTATKMEVDATGENASTALAYVARNGVK